MNNARYQPEYFTPDWEDEQTEQTRMVCQLTSRQYSGPDESLEDVPHSELNFMGVSDILNTRFVATLRIFLEYGMFES